MERKQKYQQPSLTVVTIRVEHGFEESVGVPSNASFRLFESEASLADQQKASTFSEGYWNW